MRVVVEERTPPPQVGDHTLLAFRSHVLSRKRWSAHTMWPHVFLKWKILHKNTSHKRQVSGFIWKPEDLVRLTQYFHVATTCWSWVTVVLRRWSLESHWSFSHSSSALFIFGVWLKKKKFFFFFLMSHQPLSYWEFLINIQNWTSLESH